MQKQEDELKQLLCDLKCDIDFNFIKELGEYINTTKVNQHVTSDEPVKLEDLRQKILMHFVEASGKRYENNARKYGNLEAIAYYAMLIIKYLKSQEITDLIDFEDVDDCKKVAVLKHCGYDYEETREYYDLLEQIEISDFEYTFDGRTYKVLTDREADEAMDESLDNYIDECVLPEIHSSYRNYFDDVSWKRDVSYDGRGP